VGIGGISGGLASINAGANEKLTKRIENIAANFKKFFT